MIDADVARLAPLVGTRRGHGYSGTGVGPACLGGRILSALATGGRDDPVLGLPLVGARYRRVPPEPFRYLGARVIRDAIAAREQRDDVGRASPRVLRELVRLPRRMGYDLGPEQARPLVHVVRMGGSAIESRSAASRIVTRAPGEVNAASSVIPRTSRHKAARPRSPVR